MREGADRWIRTQTRKRRNENLSVTSSPCRDHLECLDSLDCFRSVPSNKQWMVPLISAWTRRRLLTIKKSSFTISLKPEFINIIPALLNGYVCVAWSHSSAASSGVSDSQWIMRAYLTAFAKLMTFPVALHIDIKILPVLLPGGQTLHIFDTLLVAALTGQNNPQQYWQDIDVIYSWRICISSITAMQHLLYILRSPKQNFCFCVCVRTCVWSIFKESFQHSVDPHHLSQHFTCVKAFGFQKEMMFAIYYLAQVDLYALGKKSFCCPHSLEQLLIGRAEMYWINTAFIVAQFCRCSELGIIIASQAAGRL